MHMPPFRSTFFFRYFLRARGYIYLQKTPVVLRVWVLPSRHSSGSPQLDLILDWPRIHTCTRFSRSYNYSSHGELPTRRWCHSKCVVRYSSRCVRYHVFCVRICQLDGVCRSALCTNQISEINRDWGMLDHLYFGEELEKLRLNFSRSAEITQRWDRSPPTKVARVRFPDPASHVGWICGWFSSLFRGVFSGFSGFPPSTKTNTPNSNSIRKWGSRVSQLCC